MEKWEKPSHRRGGRNNPSFSSSLLDAIYRSIDETDSPQHTRGAPDPFLSPNKKKQSAAAAAEKAALRRKQELRASEPRYHQRGMFTPASSSSESSSYGGFSSSDAEQHQLRPIRTAAPPARSERIRSDLPPHPPPLQSSNHQQEKKKKMCTIKSRFQDLRKARTGSAPSSPGARLASFLNAIFSGAGSPKKAKTAAAAPPQVEESSACSSASSYARSCLTKTPPSSGGKKRSVRFGPVSVVAGGEEWRRSGYEEKDAAVARAKAREGRRMVEELLRGMESEEDGGAESDGSSDLFELENLSSVRGGYRDELPVYETTHLATNRAIAHGILL